MIKLHDRIILLAIMILAVSVFSISAIEADVILPPVPSERSYSYRIIDGVGSCESLAWLDDRILACGYYDGRIELLDTTERDTKGRFRKIASLNLGEYDRITKIIAIPGMDHFFVYSDGSEDAPIVQIDGSAILATWPTKGIDSSVVLSELDRVYWTTYNEIDGYQLYWRTMEDEGTVFTMDYERANHVYGVYDIGNSSVIAIQVEYSDSDQQYYRLYDAKKDKFISRNAVSYRISDYLFLGDGKALVIGDFPTQSGNWSSYLKRALVLIDCRTGQVLSKLMDLDIDRAAELLPGAGSVVARLRVILHGDGQRFYELSGSSLNPVEVNIDCKPFDLTVTVSPDGRMEAQRIEPDIRLVDANSGELVGYYSRGREVLSRISLIFFGVLAGSTLLTILILLQGHRRSTVQSPLLWSTSKHIHILLIVFIFAICFFIMGVLVNMPMGAFTLLTGPFVISVIFNSYSIPPEKKWNKKQVFYLLRCLLGAAVIIVIIMQFGGPGDYEGASIAQGARWSNGQGIIEAGPGDFIYPALMGAMSLIVLVLDVLIGKFVRRKHRR